MVKYLSTLFHYTNNPFRLHTANLALLHFTHHTHAFSRIAHPSIITTLYLSANDTNSKPPADLSSLCCASCYKQNGRTRLVIPVERQERWWPVNTKLCHVSQKVVGNWWSRIRHKCLILRREKGYDVLIAAVWGCTCKQGLSPKGFCYFLQFS